MFQAYIWDALVIHHLPSEGLIWWTHFMSLVLFLYPPRTLLKIYGFLIFSEEASGMKSVKAAFTFQVGKYLFKFNIKAT